MTSARPPLVLDFDGAVQPLAENEIRLPLADWQERIRFGCRQRTLRELAARLDEILSTAHGPVFFGSGDYHHVSLLLLSRLTGSEPFDLVVLDNHPDNMRYPFGIHCGSWVFHASRLPRVRHIHVIGLTGTDITLSHAWEHHLSPLFRGRVTYWSVGVRAGWLRTLGLGDRHRNFPDPESLLVAFLPEVEAASRLYLSLDKDVLDPEVVRANWDQGGFQLEHLRKIIEAGAGRLAGADICGEVSIYEYQGRFKRFMARLDGQEAVDIQQLSAWQAGHQAVNRQLLEWLDQGWVDR